MTDEFGRPEIGVPDQPAEAPPADRAGHGDRQVEDAVIIERSPIDSAEWTSTGPAKGEAVLGGRRGNGSRIELPQSADGIEQLGEDELVLIHGGRCGRVVQDGIERAQGDVAVELGEGLAVSRLAQPFGLWRILQEPGHARRQLLDVARLEQQAGPAVVDDLARPPTAEAITGVPRAMDSMASMPNGSMRDGKSVASAVS